MTFCNEVPGHPPMQEGWHKARHEFLDSGDFETESGEVIEDFRLSYVTHGRMDPNAGNAILVLSAIGSTHHRLDFLIGPGCPLDTNRYCVVCVDAIGNGLSSSPSNSARQPYLKFPRFSIRDMVASQRLLQRQLGIRQWKSVVGASMGGMQAIQWAVSFPESMESLVAMTPMAKTHPWAVAVNAAARSAISADTQWADPAHCSAGLSAWVALIQVLSARTPASIEKEFQDGTSMMTWLEQRTQVMRSQPVSLVNWVWQSHAYDAHDVGWTPGYAGDTLAALQSVKARTLVLAPPLDLYNPVSSARTVAENIPDAEYREIPSDRGHHAAGAWSAAEAGWIKDAVRDFLDGQPNHSAGAKNETA